MPVDLSEVSARALRMTASLKLAEGAHVTVVHAFELPEKPRLSALGNSRELIDSYVENCRGSIARKVDIFLHSEWKAARTWWRVVEEGGPRYVIERLTEETFAELVVMGTHARTGLMKVLFGSVTEDFLRTEGPDVLVVPPCRPASSRELRLATEVAGAGFEGSFNDGPVMSTVPAVPLSAVGTVETD